MCMCEQEGNGKNVNDEKYTKWLMKWWKINSTQMMKDASLLNSYMSMETDFHNSEQWVEKIKIKNYHGLYMMNT